MKLKDLKVLVNSINADEDAEVYLDISKFNNDEFLVVDFGEVDDTQNHDLPVFLYAGEFISGGIDEYSSYVERQKKEED